MNILLLTEDFHPNIDGGSLVRSRFTELITDRPHELTVVTGRPDGRPVQDEYCGTEVLRPIDPTPDDVQGYEFAGFLYKILFSLSVFVVGFYLLWTREIDAMYSKSYSTHWAAKILSLLFGVPLLTFIGGTPSLGRYRSSRLKLIPEFINMRCCMGDSVFVRTQQTARRVSRISGKPTEVLHGVLNTKDLRSAVKDCNPAAVRAEYDVEESEQLIIFIGRLVPLKDPETAVNVLSELPPKYKLVIIGDGPEYDALQAQITEAGVNDRVHMTGQLSHQSALKLAYSADLQLVTSKIEAYPSVVFEGLATNNEVFTTDVGVVSDIEESSLHVTDDFVKSIRATETKGTQKIDDRILERYSIERYTTDSLRTLEQLAWASQ